jgi:uncharacterized membrane protein YbhN (UPF0104 family)
VATGHALANPEVLSMSVEVAAQPRRASRRQTLLFIGALAAASLCLVWAFHDVDFRLVWAVVLQLGPAVAWVLVPYGIASVFDGLGLRRLLSALGRAVGFVRLLSIRLSADALTVSAPGGVVLAEGVRIMILQNRCDVPVTEGVGALAARKCLIVRGQGLFLALSTVIGWGYLSQRSTDVLGVPGLPMFLGGMAVVMIIASLIMGRALSGGGTAARLGMLLERVPIRALRTWLERRRTAFSQTDSHLGRTMSRGTGRQATILYFLMWLAEASETFLLLHLLGFNVSLPEALALEAVISVARALAFFVPAGLGVQDAGYVAFLRGDGGGSALELAAAFALIKRARELFWVGVGFALLLHVRKQRLPVPAATYPSSSRSPDPS